MVSKVKRQSTDSAIKIPINHEKKVTRLWSPINQYQPKNIHFHENS